MRNALIALASYCAVATANAFSASAPSPPLLSDAGILNPINRDIVLTRRDENVAKTDLTQTKAGGDLIDKYSADLALSPLERVSLTCYGNLQMVFSSFYLNPVDVKVDLFNEIPVKDEGPDKKPALCEWDRVVTMRIAGGLFCTATCLVRVYDEEMLNTLKTQDVGIGNLLRWKYLQPRFTLHEAGRLDHGGLWRFYSMDCPGMVEFDILEEFSEDAWDLESVKAAKAKGE